MKDRIFKNWKTTLIGVLIIGASLTTVFMSKATLTEAGLFIGIGFSLFFTNDKIKK